MAIYGSYKEYYPKDKDFYVYERRYKDRRLLVVCCFTAEQIRFDVPEGINIELWDLVLSNYEDCFIIANGFTTRPYELRVYLLG